MVIATTAIILTLHNNTAHMNAFCILHFGSHYCLVFFLNFSLFYPQTTDKFTKTTSGRDSQSVSQSVGVPYIYVAHKTESYRCAVFYTTTTVVVSVTASEGVV